MYLLIFIYIRCIHILLFRQNVAWINPRYKTAECMGVHVKLPSSRSVLFTVYDATN